MSTANSNDRNAEALIEAEGRTRPTVMAMVGRIQQFVQREPQARLTTLLHHVTVDALRWAFLELKKNASAGGDAMISCESRMPEIRHVRFDDPQLRIG
ncbi:MAG: hypothetical protein OXI74_17245 [Rhodospirillaceae bacterium]|nr:hypothetical protein [Rhodospirillaceae bacterium]